MHNARPFDVSARKRSDWKRTDVMHASCALIVPVPLQTNVTYNIHYAARYVTVTVTRAEETRLCMINARALIRLSLIRDSECGSGSGVFN